MDMDNLRKKFKNRITVNPDTGCWDWHRKSHPLNDGYIQTTLRPLFHSMSYIHRVSYLLFVGDLVDGMQIDHLCRNRGCSNPNHLEQVTVSMNLFRSNRDQKNPGNKLSKGRPRGWRMLVCKKGHTMDGDNVLLRGDGARLCRKCNNIRGQKSRQSKKSARLLIL